MLELLIVIGRALALALRGHRELVLENLALRQQLTAVKRTATRPHLQTRDRLFWIADGFLNGSDAHGSGAVRPGLACRITAGASCMSTSRIIRRPSGPLNKWSTHFRTIRRPAGCTEIETGVTARSSSAAWLAWASPKLSLRVRDQRGP